MTDRLGALSGFRYEPVAGLAELRTFYGSFEDDVFFSTQYIRHHSTPLYTPEPDIVHEVLGHANQLADPRVARLYRLVGHAVAARGDRRRTARALARVLVHVRVRGRRRGRELKTYGAGILSSYGELDAFRHATIRPLDFAEMTQVDYDITKYQPVLFAGRSITQVYDTLEGFLTSFDDESAARLAATAA